MSDGDPEPLALDDAIGHEGSKLLALGSYTVLLTLDAFTFYISLSDSELAWRVAGASVAGLRLCSMLWISCVDPGIVKRGRKEEEMHILSGSASTAPMSLRAGQAGVLEFERKAPGSVFSATDNTSTDALLAVNDVQWKYCHSCQAQRPPRATHCRWCNQCVMRFNHHCQILHRDIGLHNHRQFMVFVSLTPCIALFGAGAALAAIWTVVTSADDWLSVRDEALRSYLGIDVPRLLPCAVAALANLMIFAYSLPLCGTHWELVNQGQLYKEYIREIFDDDEGEYLARRNPWLGVGCSHQEHRQRVEAAHGATCVKFTEETARFWRKQVHPLERGETQ